MSDSTRALRLASAALAAGLVAWTFGDGAVLAGRGFGTSHALQLGAALALAAACLAPPSWNARVLALFVSTALMLGVAELAARRLIGARYDSVAQVDARKLYSLVPGAVREHQMAPVNGGHRVRYEINAAGFRGEALRTERDRLRVVVYGDSFIQAEFSELPETFTERLEAHLAERLGRDVEVVNAGVAGYGPDQVLRKLEEEIDVLRPDLVVVSIYAGNDFGDLVRNKLYRLDAEGRLVESEARLAPELLHRLNASRDESILKRIARQARAAWRAPAWDESAPARRARLEEALAQNLAEYQDFVVEGDTEVRELMRDPYNADLSVLPDGESARYKIALMDRVVARIAELAAARSVPLALVLVPHPLDVAGAHETLEVDRAAHPAYRPTAATDALAEIAARHAIPAVNLFEPFRARGAADLYFRGPDDHWNARGQDVAAELVAELIASRRLLAGANAEDAP